MDRLYYDSQCPLCKHEMDILGPRSRGRLQLVDIHSDAVADEQRDSLLRVLHLQTAEGDWLTGVDASVRAWSHTRWGGVFGMLRWPLIRPLVDVCYSMWAKRRYRRLYECTVCNVERRS